MRKAWGTGGDTLHRYNGLMQSVDWYKKYLRGPVDDAWYESLFDGVPAGNWGVDFSTTNYLVNDAGFARMAGFTEDSRAIILLRDPIERLWSHVKFHAEITGDLDKLPEWSIEELHNFIAHFKLHESSFYSGAIKSLFAHFPPERRLVINFEDLKTRPEGLFEDVLAFLDLPPMALPKRASEEHRINASKPLANAARHGCSFGHGLRTRPRNCGRVGRGVRSPVDRQFSGPCARAPGTGGKSPARLELQVVCGTVIEARAAVAAMAGLAKQFT